MPKSLIRSRLQPRTPRPKPFFAVFIPPGDGIFQVWCGPGRAGLQAGVKPDSNKNVAAAVIE